MVVFFLNLSCFSTKIFLEVLLTLSVEGKEYSGYVYKVIPWYLYQAYAVYSMFSKYRWVITRKAIQNRLRSNREKMLYMKFYGKIGL